MTYAEQQHSILIFPVKSFIFAEFTNTSILQYLLYKSLFLWQC